MNYHIANAFSLSGKGGNPAAIIINSGLEKREKQQVARQIGFSETAFIEANENRLFIDFYTPDRPIDYCGHATIAAANILHQQNMLNADSITIQTRLQPIRITLRNNRAYMHQPFASFTPVSKQQVLRLLNISEEDLAGPSNIGRNGVGYLLIELKDPNTLYNLTIKESEVYKFSEKHNLIGIYPYTLSGNRILSRMFGPYYGITEENATGMAAGQLAGWLHWQFGNTLDHFIIEQGYSAVMDSMGLIDVLVENKESGKEVLVGGEAVIRETKAVDMLINSPGEISVA